MKPTYIDKHGSSQKLVSGNPITGDAVYADYVKSDMGIAGSAVEYQHNGIDYRMRFVEMVVTLSEDYVTRFINQIKDFNRNWIDFGDIISVRADPNHYRDNRISFVVEGQNQINPNFGKIEPEPFNEDGSAKYYLINEIKFFQAHNGCAQNGVAIPLFDVFISSMIARLPEGAV